jgi:hypothetical protein
MIIDRSFIWELAVIGLIILAVQMLLLFQYPGQQKNEIALGVEPTFRQILIEWMLYMLVFVILANLIQAMLYLLCFYC